VGFPVLAPALVTCHTRRGIIGEILELSGLVAALDDFNNRIREIAEEGRRIFFAR
jgi:hypothetical protein